MSLMLEPRSPGNSIVFDDFSGFLYTAREPFVDASDELCLLTLDDVIRLVGMLLDLRFVLLFSPAIGFVFAGSGRKIAVGFGSCRAQCGIL